MNLDTLVSIEEIRQLMARYARLADAKRWTDLAGLFTPDGTFNSYAVDGSPVAERSGRDVIEERLTAANTDDVQPIHMFLTMEIEPTGPDTAHTDAWSRSARPMTLATEVLGMAHHTYTHV